MDESLSSNRFSSVFSTAYWFICRPYLSTLICLVFTAIISFYSIQVALLGICFSYVLFAYYIDRRHLNYLLTPPLAMLALFEFMRMGIGPAIYSIAYGGTCDEGILKMQIAHVISFPIFMVIYFLITKNVPGFIVPDFNSKNNNKLKSYLMIIGIISLIFILLGNFIGVISGSMERSNVISGGYIRGHLGWWSFYEAFIRIGDIGFILLPFLYVHLNKLYKFALGSLVIFLFLFFLLTGSRGLVGWSGIYLIIGAWLFCEDNRRLPIISIIFFCTIFMLNPIMARYRSSDAFLQTELKSPLKRINAITNFISEDTVNIVSTKKNSVNPHLVSPTLELAGTSFIGVFSDRLIYTKTPSLIPYANWDGMYGVLYLWMPAILFPEKPELYGSDHMLKPYTGVIFERSNGTISFNADMYRRFGWFGIVIGNFFIAIIYSIVVKHIFIRASNRSPLSWILVIFWISMLRVPPIGTLLRTFWHFFWELPKYLVILFILHRFILFQQRK